MLTSNAKLVKLLGRYLSNIHYVHCTVKSSDNIDSQSNYVNNASYLHALGYQVDKYNLSISYQT